MASKKSPPNRHTGGSRYPVALKKNTGFRVKHGMTKQTIIDIITKPPYITL